MGKDKQKTKPDPIDFSNLAMLEQGRKTKAEVETTQAKVEANHLAVKQAKNTEAQGVSQNIANRGSNLNDNYINNLIRPFGKMAGAGVANNHLFDAQKNMPGLIDYTKKRIEELEKAGDFEKANEYKEFLDDLNIFNNMLPDLMKLNVFDAPSWNVTVEQQRFNEWYNSVFLNWKLYGNLMAAELTTLKTF